MSDFRTKLSCSGVGRIVGKSELAEINSTSSITLDVSFVRRRQESGGTSTIHEEDIFQIKFWATGAEIISDTASIGDYIHLELEVRGSGNRIQLKAKHFDLLKGS
jgi:hypothetical protein